jgi:ribonuclease HI
LGTTSNTIVEAYTLLRGIQIIKETRCKALTMFKVSLIAIKAMNGNFIHVNSNISMVLNRKKEESKTFCKVSFFHMKRHINQAMNHWDKRASFLSLGIFTKWRGNQLY